VRAVLPSPIRTVARRSCAANGTAQPAFPATRGNSSTICIKPSAVCSMETPSSPLSFAGGEYASVACAAGNRIDWGKWTAWGFRWLMCG